MTEPLRVGLVGAGPWARQVHTPGLAGHPATTLAGVWARSPGKAAGLGAPVAGSFEELLSDVDAVAFAVPPSVQAPLAVQAARQGKHVILEKPLASTVDDAVRLADAVGEAGVATMMVLTLRFAPETAEWLAQTAAGSWSGGTARWLSGALLGGDYAASAWRHEGGGFVDVGPHVLDLLDAGLGELTGVVSARRGGNDLWQVLLEHAGGAISTCTVSLRLPIMPTVVELAVYGEQGMTALAARRTPREDCYRTLLTEFTDLIHTGRRDHPCNLDRGLHLLRWQETVTRTALS